MAEKIANKETEELLNNMCYVANIAQLGTLVKQASTSKADKSDVFLKSDDVVLAKDKIIKVIKSGESTVYDGSTENIQIRGDEIIIRRNDVESYGLILEKDRIYLETDDHENVDIKSGEITVYKNDSTGNPVAHKLTEKMSISDLKSYLLNGDQKSIIGDLYVNGGDSSTNDITLWRVEKNEPVTHKLSEKANSADIGTLSDLETTNKTSIVAAINEVKSSGGGDVLNKLTYDSTNEIINSDANLLLVNTNSVAAYNGTFRGEIKVGQLGENKWAYIISPTTGFSTSLEVTCTSGNKVHSLANKADASDVITKTNTTAFTPTADYQPATKKYVDDIVIEAGGGDMLRTVYDKDKTGTVDDSKKLGGQLPSYYSKATDIGTLADLNTTNKTNIVSAVNEKWTGKVYTIEVGNDWEIHTVTSNGEEKLGSYYQEIAVEGITSVGQPFVDVVLSDDDAQAKQQLTNYQCVSRVKTEDGKIILKCYENRPTDTFTIRILVLGSTLKKEGIEIELL